MEYIEKLIKYIDSNTKEIKMPDHNLHEEFNVSNSKLQKDFKAFQNITLRQYLINKKIEAAKSSKNPKLQTMVEINYDFTERTLRNQLKKYNKNQKLNQFENFFRNRELLEEILVRLVLFLELADIEKKSTNTIVINHKVKDTIFQFNNAFGFESLHHYIINYSYFNDSLIFSMLIYNEDYNETGTYSKPNTIKPYFNLIFNLNNKLEELLKFSITDAICDWDNYIKSISHINFITEFYDLEINLPIDSILSLNKDSEFVKKTNSTIEILKDELKSAIQIKIKELFNIEIENLSEYLKYVNNSDYNKMQQFLVNQEFNNIKKISFWLQITEIPFLEDIYLDDYEIDFHEDLLNTILQSENEKSALIITSFKKEIDRLFDIDDDVDSNYILKNVIDILI
jgi:hypothetical protein